MRAFRTISFIVFATLVALIYVHQQVELVKLSYSIGHKEKKLKEMLDRNQGLGYNIENLEDPSRLEQVLIAKNMEMAFPRPNNIVNAAKFSNQKAEDSLRAAGVDRKLNLFGMFEIFSPRAEAQTRDR
jgi:cell division protein FtsL